MTHDRAVARVTPAAAAASIRVPPARYRVRTAARSAAVYLRRDVAAILASGGGE
jgi:hypothetical protein